MSTGAGPAGEGDVGTRVNSDTVILVIDLGVGDDDIRARTNVEAVSVVTAGLVSRGVVDSHVPDGEVIAPADAESMHGGVLDVEILNQRVFQAVGGEELRLGNTAVRSLAVPPAGAIRVQLMPGRTLDGDAAALEADQRTLPLRIIPGGGAREDDLPLPVSCMSLYGHIQTRTVVSSGGLKSRVSPEGTAMLDSVIVAQMACDSMAAAAPSEPEKVHADCRLVSVGEGVIIGSGTGVASTPVAQAMRARDPNALNISISERR